jgi:hypothetical protein
VSDTRVTVNGLRHYICDGVPKPLPSVTSILTATQSQETQIKLAKWNQLNPGVADEAATRGTWIHNSVENYLRGLRVVPPERYDPFWQGVPELLDELLEGGRVLWSEKPFNQPRWSKYVGNDGVGRIHYYDSATGHGYAGCCDLIYMNENAEVILADFKTSNGPYAARFPKKDQPIDERTRKALISGVFKTKKTKLQLAAYKAAAEACLGLKISKTQIIVTTAIKEFNTQIFTFGETEVEKDQAAWFEVVKQYYEQQSAAQNGN